MEVEKVDIKELWFTEQLLYWNDIKDNRIKELEEENKILKEEKKSIFKRYDYAFLFICYLTFFWLWFYTHWSIALTSQKSFMKQECIEFLEELSVR